jgi:DNA-binding CsgD family transcriptional regulator
MSGARSVRFAVAGTEYVVLSVPIGLAEDSRLSPAERAVVAAALQGLSTRDIARQRSTSPRTVANQLASAFHKLNVHSRSELASYFLSRG